MVNYTVPRCDQGLKASPKQGQTISDLQRWTPEFGQLAKVDSPNQKGATERWQNDASTRPY